MSVADDGEDGADQELVWPNGPKTLHLGVLTFLDRVADSTLSPAVDLLHAQLAATKPTANDRDRRDYEALRDHLLKRWVPAPNGVKYRLTTLQRKYLHHQLTRRYKASGATWEAAWQSAAEYCSIGKKKPIPASTVKDHYSYIENLLKQDGMRKFCRGLEYEFQIAVHGDKEPPVGTFLDPEFLRSTPGEQAEK
ncbi:MAG: hypothetical protein ACTHLC_11360 [Rhizobiaceae bacterium]